jgi:hypothetical protein
VAVGSVRNFAACVLECGAAAPLLTGRPFMRWRIAHPRLDRSLYFGIERQFRGTGSSAHDMNCKNTALMARQQIIDKIAND